MCCLFLSAAFVGPRFALLLVWIFGDRIQLAYDTWFWPFLGLLFLPWTTLFYAFAWSAVVASTAPTGSSSASASHSTSSRTRPARRPRGPARRTDGYSSSGSRASRRCSKPRLICSPLASSSS